MADPTAAVSPDAREEAPATAPEALRNQNRISFSFQLAANDSTYTDEAPATADEARVAAPDAAEEAADDLRAQDGWYEISFRSEMTYRAVPEAAEEAPEAAGAPPAAPEAAGQLVVAPAVTVTLFEESEF